jgi:tRNA threonylcarbamoyladenosine biosynthesis protein TsaE
MTFITESENDFRNKIWETIEPKLKPGLVLGIVGDLGAGKTTLVKQIAQKLGFKGQVSSPTFVIRKSYPLKNNKGIKSIEHIDLYRLGQSGACNLREVKDYLEDKDSLVLIEWANLLNDKKILNGVIKIQIRSSVSRKVEILWN